MSPSRLATRHRRMRVDHRAGAHGPTGHVVALAHGFAGTLTAAQRSSLELPLDAATLRRWSNYPEAVLGRRGRPGLRTATLDATQWDALLALLAAVTGSGTGVGSDALQGHLAADDLLHDRAGDDYGRSCFTVAVHGTPSDTGAWALTFGGHHLAIVSVFRGGRLVGVTPSFRGIEPFGAFERDGRTHRPMLSKQRSLAALVQSLDRDQRRAARIDERGDILLGPGRDGAFPVRAEGLPGAALSASQRDALVAAMASFVADAEDAAAAATLRRYAAASDDTHVAFAGTPSLAAIGDYVRLDGPDAWIELSMHDGIILPAPHPHAVWRDKRHDYGA